MTYSILAFSCIHIIQSFFGIMNDDDANYCERFLHRIRDCQLRVDCTTATYCTLNSVDSIGVLVRSFRTVLVRTNRLRTAQQQKGASSFF